MVRHIFLELKEAFLDLLFPPFCVGCRCFGTYLCPNCYSQIYFYTLAPKLTLEVHHLDQLIVTAHYAPPLSRLITAYKYGQAKILSQTLVELIWYTTNLPQVDLLTYIPLHPKKLSERGFNQTQLLAEKLSQKMNTPCLATLIKTKHHLAQAKTSSRENRLTNLEQTFALSPQFLDWYHHQTNPPQSIMIIDDVVTTGTTLNEAAKILKALGIKKVSGYAVAHD